MILNELRLTNFRSFEYKSFEFSSQINAITGDNGAGKTNILDAIHFLCLTKSYLSNSDKDCINFNADFLSLFGLFSINGDEDELLISLKREDKKVLKRNGKTYARLSDHIGYFPAVMISPYDSNLITEGSDVRRKFLDSMISQGNAVYLQQLIRYNKVLAHRNKLLKNASEIGYLDKDTLSVFDHEFVPLAEFINRERTKAIQNFNQHFQKYYVGISGKNEVVSVEYRSTLSEANFAESLKAAMIKDRAARHSTEGIHRDDLTFLIKDKPIKKFGSQGQQKSFLIALKLAKMEALKSQSGRKPLLLLDDIFDKLDDNRVSYLIELVSENDFGQIFITDTHAERTQKSIEKIGADFKMFSL